MKTLGALLLAAHLAFLAVAALLAGASFAAFLGESWMIAAGVAVLALWGTYAGLTAYALTRAVRLLREDVAALEAALAWSNGLFLVLTILSPLTGLLLAFGAFAACGPLFLAGLYHWTGLAATVLGFTAFFALPSVAKACLGSGEGRRAWLLLVTALPVAILWGLAWIVGYALLGGSVRESEYPPLKEAKYLLPWPGGEASWVIQGNDSSLNHNGSEKFAWDFRRRCGTPVLAARDGTVIKVEHDFDGHGENNMIEVQHEDKSIGRYLHIQAKSAAVKKNDKVKQGDLLARAGNVGNSLTGHIHFVVENEKRACIAVVFKDADVKGDAGIPRGFSSYTSGNRR